MWIRIKKPDWRPDFVIASPRIKPRMFEIQTQEQPIPEEKVSLDVRLPEVKDSIVSSPSSFRKKQKRLYCCCFQKKQRVSFNERIRIPVPESLPKNYKPPKQSWCCCKKNRVHSELSMYQKDKQRECWNRCLGCFTACFCLILNIILIMTLLK
jgi:hypothetical protein